MNAGKELKTDISLLNKVRVDLLSGSVTPHTMFSRRVLSHARIPLTLSQKPKKVAEVKINTTSNSLFQNLNNLFK